MDMEKQFSAAEFRDIAEWTPQEYRTALAKGDIDASIFHSRTPGRGSIHSLTDLYHGLAVRRLMALGFQRYDAGALMRHVKWSHLYSDTAWLTKGRILDVHTKMVTREHKLFISGGELGLEEDEDGLFLFNLAKVVKDVNRLIAERDK